MRKLSAGIIDKLKQPIQTHYHRNELGFDMTLTRGGSSPLASADHVETVRIPIGRATDIDVSGAHDTLYGIGGDIWISTITDGRCKVFKSPFNFDITKTTFELVADLGPAITCCIGHDGELYSVGINKEVWVTKPAPYVFWTDVSGALLMQDMNEPTSPPTTIFTEACTDVACVNGTRNTNDLFDYGFCVFYIQNDKVRYIQYSDGVWHPSHRVPAFQDKRYIAVSAVRTWDYRLAVTATDSDGVVTRAYTMYQGFGKHIRDNYNATTELKLIVRRNDPPIITAVENIDNGSGDWGLLVKITYNMELYPNTVNPKLFKLKVRDTEYTAKVVSVTGNTLVIEFEDFNSFQGETTVELHYKRQNDFYGPTNDNVMSNDYILAEGQMFEFTPINLYKVIPMGKDRYNTDNTLTIDIITKTMYEGCGEDNYNVESMFDIDMVAVDRLTGKAKDNYNVENTFTVVIKDVTEI